MACCPSTCAGSLVCVGGRRSKGGLQDFVCNHPPCPWKRRPMSSAAGAGRPACSQVARCLRCGQQRYAPDWGRVPSRAPPCGVQVGFGCSGVGCGGRKRSNVSRVYGCFGVKRVGPCGPRASSRSHSPSQSRSHTSKSVSRPCNGLLATACPRGCRRALVGGYCSFATNLVFPRFSAKWGWWCGPAPTALPPHVTAAPLCVSRLCCDWARRSPL